MALTFSGGTGATVGSGAAGTVTAPAEVVASPARWLFVMGDSTAYQKTWPASLLARLTAAGAPWTAIVNGSLGGGGTVLSLTSILPSILATTDWLTAPTVLISLGINDMSLFTDATYGPTWIANYTTLIARVRLRWPTARVYLMRPWGRDGGSITAAKVDLLAGWVATLVATLANVLIGPDNRTYYKGTDDGATNTLDGIHQNAAGNTAWAVAWQAVLWP